MLEQARPRPHAESSGVAAWAAVAQRYASLVVLFALVSGAVVLVPGFASVSNASSILQSVALVGIVAVGMTLVVISGNFVDLSAPSQVTVSALLVLGLSGISLPLAIAAGLMATIGIGLLNGVLIGRLRANPVIVTLGVQTAMVGVIITFTGGSYLYGTSEALSDAGKVSIGPIPIQALVFLGALLMMQLVLARSRYGFQLYAVGSNRTAARASGIPDVRVVVATFALAGLFAGISGLFLAAFVDSANSSAGTGYEFDALTAVVVGGTSLFGGKGSLWRTLSGVFFIGVLNNVMILSGLPFEAQLLVKGSVIVLAVALDAYAQRRVDL